ncbi:MAG: cytochrome c oxidase subunit II [Flavobacteriales bacterium]
MKLLILLVFILGIVALVQLSKVYQLTSNLRNKREEDISEADNRLSGGLFLAFMVVFYASVVWLVVRYGDYAPPPASLHGEAVDQLMNFNMAIIFLVFFLVNTFLFVFSAKYYFRKDRKARFFAHDNRLELVWTVIPSIVLAVIIAYGLKTWNDMTGEASEDALRVEIYSKQFDWTARYPGNDAEFGLANYNLITPTNPLGIVTEGGVESALEELEEKMAKIESELAHERGHLLAEKAELEAQLHDAHGHAHDDHHGEGHHGMSDELRHAIEHRLAEVEEMLSSDEVVILTDAAFEAKEDKLYRLQRHRQRVSEIEFFNFDEGLSAWETGMDDKIVKGEFHLPIGREVEFVFRSRDVLHSAYMPHFRAQMNTVPGVPTRFKMTPTISTDSMRVILDDPDFNYVLLCNKVCGAAHFNMQMKLVVESEEEYQAWLEQQDEFLVKEETDEEKSDEGVAQSEKETESITASL